MYGNVKMPFKDYERYAKDRIATLEAEARAVQNWKSEKRRYLTRLAYAYKNRLAKRKQAELKKTQQQEREQLIERTLSIVKSETQPAQFSAIVADIDRKLPTLDIYTLVRKRPHY